MPARKLTIKRTIAAAATLLAGAGIITAAAAWSPAASSATVNTAAAAVTSAAVAQPDVSVYTVDKLHTVGLFRIRHAGVAPFWGRFNSIDGEFFIDEANPSKSHFKATIDMNSVDTNNGQRDAHIRNADFFNARQFPTATFESTSFASTDEEGIFELKGNLTLVGQTKEVTARVEYGGVGSFRGKPAQGFEATFEIKRTDFGITTYVAPDGGESGALGNTVRIVIGVEGHGK